MGVSKPHTASIPRERERKEGRKDGWKDGRMEGWKDGRMEGRKEDRQTERKKERKKNIHIYQFPSHVLGK